MYKRLFNLRANSIIRTTIGQMNAYKLSLETKTIFGDEND